LAFFFTNFEEKKREKNSVYQFTQKGRKYIDRDKDREKGRN
jgi:hypothetical protein